MDQSSIEILLVNERRFRALIEHSADGLALIDRHGVVRYVSPAVERITGLALAEFVGTKAFAFVHPSDKEAIYDHMAGLLAAPGTATVELRLRHQDGSWRWIEAMLTNLLDDPDVSALVVNFRDVSSRRETEKELQQFANELAGLHRQERRARMQAETLRKANLAVTRTLTLDVVLGAMFAALVRLVPYDLASMLLLREDEVTAVYQMRGSQGTEVTLLPPDAVDLEHFPPLKALLTADAGLLVADTADGTDKPGCSWLGVPMRINGVLIGLCTLEVAGPGRYNEDHLQWVEAVVAQASVAIQNAQLFEEVRHARGQLQTLSHELIRVQETERRALARELHDEIGQVLIALQLNLRGMQERKAAAATKESRLADSIGLVDQLIQQVRSLSRELRPPLLDDLGLTPALNWHLDQLTKRSGIECKLNALIGEQRLPSEVEISVFRIVQEALNNVVKHARATHVRVELRQSMGELRVSITDDGVGFDPDAAHTKATSGASLGLISMQERALLANGTTEIISAPEAGTCVRARFILASA